MWGLDGGWKETDKIHSRFFKTKLGVPRFSANSVTELELGRDSSRGKLLRTIATFWLSLLRKDSREIVRTCYVWQLNNLKVESWTKKLKEELEEIRLTYI
jgi:hypothetical protein